MGDNKARFWIFFRAVINGCVFMLNSRRFKTFKLSAMSHSTALMCTHVTTMNIRLYHSMHTLYAHNWPPQRGGGALRSETQWLVRDAIAGFIHFEERVVRARVRVIRVRAVEDRRSTAAGRQREARAAGGHAGRPAQPAKREAGGRRATRSRGGPAPGTAG